jgi:hypothetical protein
MPGGPRRATDYVNRNNVKHGLDDPSDWKKVGCLRLFQVLDDAAEVSDRL